MCRALIWDSIPVILYRWYWHFHFVWSRDGIVGEDIEWFRWMAQDVMTFPCRGWRVDIWRHLYINALTLCSIYMKLKYVSPFGINYTYVQRSTPLNVFAIQMSYYGDIIRELWRHKSPATPLSVQQLVQANSKGNIKIPYRWLCTQMQKFHCHRTGVTAVCTKPSISLAIVSWPNDKVVGEGRCLTTQMASLLWKGDVHLSL